MSRSASVAALVCVLSLGACASAAAHAEVAGTLVEMHGDRVDGTMVDQSYAVDSSSGVRPLTDPQPASLVGQRVGVRDRSPAAGLQGVVRPAGEQRLAAAVPQGPRSLLVIVLTTPDEPRAAATADEARHAIFTGEKSANALFQQQSGGATRFVGRVRDDGDVSGPLAIGVATTGCETSALADAADVAASADGWAVDAYDHVLYLLPHTSECDWGGLGQLPGRRSWSNGYLATSVIAHELGHNLGAHHANSYSCADAGGQTTTLSAACTSKEYGDPFDVMGLPPRLMSSWHRAQLGQLPAAQQLSLRGSQTVALSSSNDASTGPSLLLVPRKQPGIAVSSWLAVELRSEVAPFDVWGVGNPVTTGLSVRLVPNLTVARQSQLLDARPATSSFDDASLQVGQSLADESHGIVIHLDAIDAGTGRVTVTMPPLVDDVPPSAPDDPSVAGDTNGVAIKWQAADDDEAIAHYEVERDGVVIGTTPGLRFDDARVTNVTRATYRVIAVDTSGNRASSRPITTTLRDATPPSAVPGLTMAAVGADTVATWTAAQDNRAVANYRIYRNGVLRTTVKGLRYSERPPEGRHLYAVSAVDPAGNVGPRTDARGMVVVTVVDGEKRKKTDVRTIGSPADRTSPRLSGLKSTPRRFRVSQGKLVRTSRRSGTTIELTLSEQAAVRFTFARSATGRRTGHGCGRQTRSNRSGKPCTRYVAAGTLHRQLSAGRVSMPFSVRINGRDLRPGVHRVTAVPTDAAGNTGQKRVTTLTVIAG